MGLAWFTLFISLIFAVPLVISLFRYFDLVYWAADWFSEWFPVFINRLFLWFLLIGLLIIPTLLLGSLIGIVLTNSFRITTTDTTNIINWIFLRGILLIIIIGLMISGTLYKRLSYFLSRIIAVFFAMTAYICVEIIIVTVILGIYSVSLNTVSEWQALILITVILNLPWLIVWWSLPDHSLQGVATHG